MKVGQEQGEFMAYLEMVARNSVEEYNTIHPHAERYMNVCSD